MAQVSRYYYTEDGNAARRLLPEREWEEEQKRQREERKRQHHARRTAQARARRRARLRLIPFTASLLVISGFFMVNVYLQSSISESMRNIATMQSEISDLKAENAATENRIHINANLENVKAKAANELGMVYANNDQIVYYSMDDTDYMDQYDKIP